MKLVLFTNIILTMTASAFTFSTIGRTHPLTTTSTSSSIPSTALSMVATLPSNTTFVDTDIVGISSTYTEKQQLSKDDIEAAKIREEFTTSRSLPKWGKAVNEAFNMPVITHADSKHVHALAGTVWFSIANGLMAYALFEEVTSNDWTSFSSLSGVLAVACMSALTMGVTSSPMLPTRKSMSNYAASMRHGMVSFSLAAMMTAFLSMTNTTDMIIPSSLGDVTNVVVIAGLISLFIDLVEHNEPFNVANVIRDLKREDPPRWIMNSANTVIFVWLITLLATATYILTGSYQVADESTNTFATQMAFSLAMAPSTSAFAGTLMQRDRFGKKSGDHWFVVEREDGTFGDNTLFDVLQLVLGAPGPYLATFCTAIGSGHLHDVQQFFYPFFGSLTGISP